MKSGGPAHGLSTSFMVQDVATPFHAISFSGLNQSISTLSYPPHTHHIEPRMTDGHSD